MSTRGKIVRLPPNRVWRTYPGGRTLDALAMQSGTGFPAREPSAADDPTPEESAALRAGGLAGLIALDGAVGEAVAPAPIAGESPPELPPPAAEEIDPVGAAARELFNRAAASTPRESAPARDVLTNLRRVRVLSFMVRWGLEEANAGADSDILRQDERRPMRLAEKVSRPLELGLSAPDGDGSATPTGGGPGDAARCRTDTVAG